MSSVQKKEEGGEGVASIKIGFVGEVEFAAERCMCPCGVALGDATDLLGIMKRFSLIFLPRMCDACGENVRWFS